MKKYNLIAIIFAIVFSFSEISVWAEPVEHVHNWDSSEVIQPPDCMAAGLMEYSCACGETRTEEIPATGKHIWSAYQTVSDATVFKPAKQSRSCKSCGKTEITSIGSKLPRKMKLSASKLVMKTGQKITTFKVTGMAKGDSVLSWNSTDIRVVRAKGKADGTCIITARNRPGKAKIYITLKSGLKKSVKVRVQREKVKTTRIKGIASKAVLKKGKTLALHPVRLPLSSKEKITYTSSNKKVALVSRKGIVKAVKRGKATITVRSGKVKVSCRITIK